MIRQHPEDDFQRSVALLLNSANWLWWHTPNGGRRWKLEAKRFKAMGVKPGVPDILIFERWFCPCLDQEHDPTNQGSCDVCAGFYKGFGVALELKAGKNRVTPAQQQVLTDLQRRGWLCGVCWNMGQVARLLRCVRPVNGVLIS